MSESPSWDLYRSFLAVLRTGSLSGAARSLRVAQPTIGRHIDTLEQTFGSPLFLRRQTGLSPTNLALSLLGPAEAMEAAAAALVRATGDAQQNAGTVRISASEIMGVEILPAILAGMTERHPGLTVELSLDNRLADLPRRDADIAVRMVRPTQNALVAQRLGEVEIGLFAHKSYIARRGQPREVTDIAKHVVIGYDRDDYAIRRLAEDGITLSRHFFGLRSDSDCAQLALLRAGAGIGGCQTPLARRSPELVRILPNAFGFKLEVWLAVHEGSQGDPPTQHVFDFLAEGLSDYLQDTSAK